MGVAVAEESEIRKYLPSCEPVIDRLDPGNLKHGDVSKQSPCEAVTAAPHPDLQPQSSCYSSSAVEMGD